MDASPTLSTSGQGFLYLLFFILTDAVALLSGGQDYCQWEMFNATCPGNQLILMENARYGRMRVGRCVSMEYGHLGCYDDKKTLSYTDHKCSGRERCQFPVADFLQQGFLPCPKDVSPYFEASYTCIDVAQGSHSQCVNEHHIVVRGRSSGYIANGVTERTNVGSPSCPWTLELEPGQRINLTLIDFGVWARQGASGDVTSGMFCHKYAVIQEGDPIQETPVCASTDRVKSVFTSKTNRIKIIIPRPSRMQSAPQFLLHYEAIGCPRLRTPINSHVSIQGQSAKITCNSTNHVTHLTCIGNKWSGTMSNCSNHDLAPSTWNILFGASWSSSHGIFVVVALGIGLGVIIGVLMLAAAVLLLRKKGWLLGCEKQPASEPVYAPSADSKYIAGGSKTTNADSAYSSEALLSDNMTLDRGVWPYTTHRASRTSQSTLGHIYECPQFPIGSANVNVLV